MMTERQLTAARANFKKATAVRTALTLARRPVLICEHCRSEFTVPPSQVRNSGNGSPRRFCSRACRYEAMRGDAAPNAGNSEGISGERNPNWKGGIPLDERTRQPYQAELSQWRRRVYHRDSYTCQRCGISPKTRNTLRAHHIAPWAKNAALRFELTNGVTLCRDCHGWVHSPDNTEQDFLA